MRILNNRDIEALATPTAVIAAVEQAMIAFEEGRCHAPKRMHLDHGDNTLLCMPAFAGDVFSTKLVSVVPANRDKGLPVTNGCLVLNDAATGLPLALMNAASLTALRTGALGALGVKYTTPDDVDSIGLIGTGVQGIQQALFACHVRPIKTVYVLKRKQEPFDALVAMMRAQHPDVHVLACASAGEMLTKTRVVITATTSPTPVLPDDEALLAGRHFIGIGSYRPYMREFPDGVCRLAGALSIDSEFARHEVGDILIPLERGLLDEGNVFTLGKLITGARTINRDATTAYKSAGMAMFDLFTAKVVYELALAGNIGTVAEL